MANLAAPSQATAQAQGAGAEGDEQRPSTSNMIELPVSALEASPLNPRKTFDENEIADLAESIAAEGLLQNLVARPVGHGRFEVVAGGRRLRALQKLANEGRAPRTVRVLVRPLTDAEVILLAITENNQRQDVDPLEEAEAFAALRRARAAEGDEGKVSGEIAAAIGRTTRYVQERIRLAENLAPELKNALNVGELNATMARRAARLPEARQKDLARALGGWHAPTDEASLEDWIRHGSLSATHALFSLDDYRAEGGEVDEVDGETRLLSVGLARELQHKILLDRAIHFQAKSREKYPKCEVHIVEHSLSSWSELMAKPKDAPADLVHVYAVLQPGSLETSGPALCVSRKAYQNWQARKATGDRVAAAGGEAGTAPKPLPNAAWLKGALDRTRALREVIAADPRTAIAAFLVQQHNRFGNVFAVRADRGLLSGDQLQVESGDAFEAACDRLCPIYNQTGDTDEGVRLLAALDFETLCTLLGAWLADRAFDVKAYSTSVGSDPLALAIIQTARVKPDLENTVTADRVASYTKDQLLAIWADLKQDPADLDGLKVAEIRERVLAAAPATYTLPETRFLREADARKAEARLLAKGGA